MRLWTSLSALGVLALLVAGVLGAPEPLRFLLAALGLLPLAALMGEATEALAARVGAALGGLLNASFGNATELIFAIIALKAGQVEVVKASISGSILSNLLLVLGLSFFIGGLRYKVQRYSAEGARVLATMLTLALIALLLPAVFHLTLAGYYGAAPELPDRAFSRAVAVVLIAVYLANLAFSFFTHRDLVSPPHAARHAEMSVTVALFWLLMATLGVVYLSEVLVHTLEAATRAMGLSPFFVGIVLVPLVGNAAEHLAAVLFAAQNKMELSVQIAVGSSLQIALFVAPILVFFGLDLVFKNPLELAALFASVVAVNQVVEDGQSHWLEGAMLLGVYALLALAFFFTPHAPLG